MLLHACASALAFRFLLWLLSVAGDPGYLKPKELFLLQAAFSLEVPPPTATETQTKTPL